MSNMIDYLKWRGDLTFSGDRFNEIDNLILSQLVYVDMTGIFSEDDPVEDISVLHAARYFFETHTEQELAAYAGTARNALLLFKEMATCRRFQNARLSRYTKDISEQEQSQFSALTITLDDGSVYVAFCGTDTSLIGWREDFNMLYLNQLPGQEKAVAYLNRLGLRSGVPLRIGGHSKGGNFAIYAAMHSHAPIQESIVQVYNNDGPGFSKEVVESSAYRKILPFTRTIVPESSIVGMLFEHEEHYVIVRSDSKGLKQHSAMSWQVQGNHFVYADNLLDQSICAKKAITEWLSLLPLDRRKEIVEAVFLTFESIGIQSVYDFRNLKFKDIRAIIQTRKKMPQEVNDSITDATLQLIKIILRSFAAP